MFRVSVQLAPEVRSHHCCLFVCIFNDAQSVLTGSLSCSVFYCVFVCMYRADTAICVYGPIDQTLYSTFSVNRGKQMQHRKYYYLEIWLMENRSLNCNNHNVIYLNDIYLWVIFIKWLSKILDSDSGFSV